MSEFDRLRAQKEAILAREMSAKDILISRLQSSLAEANQSLECRTQELNAVRYSNEAVTNQMEQMAQKLNAKQGELAHADKDLSDIYAALGIQDCHDPAGTIKALRTQLDQKDAALKKIDAIRNSIIGFQKVNWSEHIYPLVAALEDAGYHGKSYEENLQVAKTLLATIKDLEDQLDQAVGVLKEIKEHEHQIRPLECSCGFKYGNDAIALHCYRNGVLDGHRCTAALASKGLEIGREK